MAIRRLRDTLTPTTLLRRPDPYDPAMSATVIDGRAIAAGIREQVAAEVEAFTAQTGRPPGLATVLVGDDPGSAVYVASKQRACAEVGMRAFDERLSAQASVEEVGA